MTEANKLTKYSVSRSTLLARSQRTTKSLQQRAVFELSYSMFMGIMGVGNVALLSLIMFTSGFGAMPFALLMFSIAMILFAVSSVRDAIDHIAAYSLRVADENRSQLRQFDRMELLEQQDDVLNNLIERLEVEES